MTSKRLDATQWTHLRDVIVTRALIVRDARKRYEGRGSAETLADIREALDALDLACNTYESTVDAAIEAQSAPAEQSK